MSSDLHTKKYNNNDSPSRQRVVVAMSGGVDSSVAAASLVQQGYDVIGMMLRLWSDSKEEQTNRCCTPDSMALAKRIADQLNIPFYAVDAQDKFFLNVVSPFINGYTNGVTPNPCLICNRTIRWGFLMDRAKKIGADILATGHYARISPKDDEFQLSEGVDKSKDQSYVLYTLNQADLKHTIFPLGDYSKEEVRQLASEFNLPVADRSDSQDLCFIGDGDYRNFLTRYAPDVSKSGPIINRTGEQIGTHTGLAFYTIGQRKRLGISSHTPLYVLAKDTDNNTLVVGNIDDLGEDVLVAESVNWISEQPPIKSFRAQVKIRYKSDKFWAKITPVDTDRIQVLFDQNIRDITPGQAAVIFNGEVCMGGGIISK
jgi:tRNA-specific 2-thiouridylase